MIPTFRLIANSGRFNSFRVQEVSYSGLGRLWQVHGRVPALERHSVGPLATNSGCERQHAECAGCAAVFATSHTAAIAVTPGRIARSELSSLESAPQYGISCIMERSTSSDGAELIVVPGGRIPVAERCDLAGCSARSADSLHRFSVFVATIR